MLYYFALASMMQDGHPGVLRVMRELERSKQRNEEMRCVSEISQSTKYETLLKSAS